MHITPSCSSTVFASNTSSLSITDIADATERKDRWECVECVHTLCVCLRGCLHVCVVSFSPVHLLLPFPPLPLGYL